MVMQIIRFRIPFNWLGKRMHWLRKTHVTVVVLHLSLFWVAYGVLLTCRIPHDPSDSGPTSFALGLGSTAGNCGKYLQFFWKLSNVAIQGGR